MLFIALTGLALAACAPVPLIDRLEDQLRSRFPRSSATPPVATPEVGVDTEQAAIQLVIHRGNFQQEQAIAARDPAIMRETATETHYQELVRTNRDLLRGGVTRIKLVQLEWGPIVLRGATATATTFETWAVTFANGATQQSRDRNLYRLIKQDGTWKIQSNEHPDGPATLPPGGPEVNRPYERLVLVTEIAAQ